MVHDFFSKQSPKYAQFRPAYPAEMFSWLARRAPCRQLAWDCAAGSGQAAQELGRLFERVVATDVSAQQLHQSVARQNIELRQEPAESPSLADASVDLITVAQALHWFDFERFWPQALRVLKPKGIFAAWAYGFSSVNPLVDPVLNRLGREILKGYWSPGNRIIIGGYEQLACPLERLPNPPFDSFAADWTLAELTGYLSTWSAVQKYKDANEADPLELVRIDLASAWGDPEERRRSSWKLTWLLARR